MNKILRLFLIPLLLLLIPCSEAFALRGAALKSLCADPAYTCVKVRGGQSWQSMFPNIDQRDAVMRVNRMNTQLYQGMTIAVPRNLASVQTIDLAPFDKQIPADGNKTVVVNGKSLAWGAYDEQGKLTAWGPVSMGKGWCPDIGSRCRTPGGTFTVYEKRGAGCKSTKFPVGIGGAPMPHCMFFHGGYALHASQVPGYNASHGCVRLFYPDARWLNQEFIDGNTKIVVRPNGEGI